MYLKCIGGEGTLVKMYENVLAGGIDLGAGKLGADFGRLNYLLRGKGQASRFIYISPGP